MSEETVPKKKAKPARHDFKSELVSLRNRVTTAVMLLKKAEGTTDEALSHNPLVSVAIELLEGEK